MKKERPGIRLQATVANVDTLKDMLLDNRLDAAMIEAPIDHRDLTGEAFSRDELALILPPGHPLLQKTASPSRMWRPVICFCGKKEVRGAPFWIRSSRRTA